MHYFLIFLISKIPIRNRCRVPTASYLWGWWAGRRARRRRRRWAAPRRGCRPCGSPQEGRRCSRRADPLRRSPARRRLVSSRWRGATYTASSRRETRQSGTSRPAASRWHRSLRVTYTTVRYNMYTSNCVYMCPGISVWFYWPPLNTVSRAWSLSHL